MTPTPVGMRCPECSKQRTRVTRMSGDRPPPTVTQVLIGINIFVYLAQALSGGGFASGGRGELMVRGELYGPWVAYRHEYWRLVTSGFMHAGFFHLAMNMVFIWILGQMLEPALGKARFLTLYLVSLLCGSAGALLIEPLVPVVGASGAAFGLLGAAIVMHLRRGLDLRDTGLVPVLLINLAITFLVPGIAIGAHVGGVIGGFAAGWLLEEAGERFGKGAALAATVALGVFAVALAVAAASSTGLIQNPTGL